MGLEEPWLLESAVTARTERDPILAIKISGKEFIAREVFVIGVLV